MQLIKALMLSVALLMSSWTMAAESDAAVISSRDLSRQEAIAIYSFDQFHFKDGTRIKMYVLPRDHSTTRDFTYWLGTTPARFHEKAEQGFSTGKYNMLKVVDTDRDALREVRRTIDSIGYVKSYIIIDGDSIFTVRLR